MVEAGTGGADLPLQRIRQVSVAAATSTLPYHVAPRKAPERILGLADTAGLGRCGDLDAALPCGPPKGPRKDSGASRYGRSRSLRRPRRCPTMWPPERPQKGFWGQEMRQVSVAVATSTLPYHVAPRKAPERILGPADAAGLGRCGDLDAALPCGPPKGPRKDSGASRCGRSRSLWRPRRCPTMWS